MYLQRELSSVRALPRGLSLSSTEGDKKATRKERNPLSKKNCSISLSFIAPAQRENPGSPQVVTHIKKEEDVHWG